MFPFRPSRTAAALLELAEAMLAPEAFDAADGDVCKPRARRHAADRRLTRAAQNDHEPRARCVRGSVRL
jgi:hypothetical protein